MKKVRKILTGAAAVTLSAMMTLTGSAFAAFADDAPDPETESISVIEEVSPDDADSLPEQEQTIEEPETEEPESAAEASDIAETKEEPEISVTEESSEAVQSEAKEAETAEVASEQAEEITEPEVTVTDEPEESDPVIKYEISLQDAVTQEKHLASKENSEVQRPEIKSVEAAGDGIKVTWNAVSGAETYRVYRRTDPSGSWIGYLWVKGGAASFTDKNTDGGKTYYYTLRAIYANGDVSTYDPSGQSIAIKNTSGWKLSLPQEEYQHTGKERKPALTVVDGSATLEEGKDFEVSYSNNLNPGTATVTATGKGIYRGTASTTFTIKMKTPALTTAKVQNSGVYVAWKEVPGADFYRVYYRKSGDSKWAKLGDTKSTEYFNDELKPGATYVFNVRSFHNNGQYSNYSEAPYKSVKFVKPVLRKADGEWWYYAEDGKIDRTFNGFFTDEDGTWEIEDGKLIGQVYGDRLAMYNKAQRYDSDTSWLILVNRTTHRLGLYQWKYGRWTENRYVACGDGAYSTPTVEGEFAIQYQAYYFDSDNVRCFYASRFYGAYWIHSILFAQDPEPMRVIDGSLGVAVSHGCVRLALANAVYIFNNCDVGTTVVVYH